MSLRSIALLTGTALSFAMGGQTPLGGPVPPGGTPDAGAVALPPPFLAAPTPWADSVLLTLSMEQRIAQLMMVAAYSNKDAKHEASIEALVRDRGIGGLIFFQGGPRRQARLTDRYQEAARVPLLLGMDLEWGLAMRLDSTIRFPRQMALGAHRDEALIEEMGQEIARQMKAIGVHVSFSPVVDVNNNPRNPVINDRSFGEDVENVARKGIAYMRGLQRGGVLAVAKHFPGHGDTDSDSHLTLPVVAHARERLEAIELPPFRAMVGAGLAAMMVAHLEVPALEPGKGTPSTLSRTIVTDLLEKELGFQGLVFTDALNMKGVANADKPGEIELRALLAGNDVMLFPQDPEKAIQRIVRALEEGVVDSALVTAKCLKVLRAKEWAGAHRRVTYDRTDLLADLNTGHSRWLRRSLYAKALTVASDHHGLLPLRNVDPQTGGRTVSIAIGADQEPVFQSAMRWYADVRTVQCAKELKPDSLQRLLASIEDADRVIVSVHGTTWRVGKDFGIPESAMSIVRAIADKKPTVFVLFANPYRLTKASGALFKATTVVAYEETDDTQELAAALLFGAQGADGRLPVSLNAFHRLGDGLVVPSLGRLGHQPPEAVGIRAMAFDPIGDIVRKAINEQACPGAQVLVAVDGQVVLERAFGHQTYDKKRAVRPDDLYDLASITKVASTTLALMKLVDEGRVDLDHKLGHYLPELEKSHPQHARMGLREILTHQAGLKAFVPFHLRIMQNGTFKPGTVSDSASAEFPVRIAGGLYLHKAYADSLLPWVLNTPLGTKGDYVYSDMGYYLLQALIERTTGRPLDQYVEEIFYRPMGAHTLCYKPWQRFPLDRIAPTEYDVAFRKRQIHGDVHDPGAALKGGVAGHAGLFGSANDLAKIFQLLLDNGVYAGHRYLGESTVREFTKCQFCKPDGSGNRRALGFDRPARGGKGPTCDCVSYASFGHTGFTGTMAWADPESRVVYIFLSNRVYPNSERNRLVELGTRTKVQEVVHAAVAARIVAQRNQGK